MKPILTSKITLYCSDYSENSFSVASTIQLNLSRVGVEKSTQPSRYPFSSIEQLILEAPNKLLAVTGPEASKEHRNFIIAWFSEMIERAVARTMIPISLLGKSFRLILSLSYLDGALQLMLTCPAGGTEGIKEWSSDVLSNFRTIGLGC